MLTSIFHFLDTPSGESATPAGSFVNFSNKHQFDNDIVFGPRKAIMFYNSS